MADEQKTPTSYNGFETVTVSTTSKALTAATYVNQTFALVTVEVAAVRFRLDNATAPTASIGHVLEVGAVLELDSLDQIKNVRFIRRDGADATLSVSYGA